MAAKPITKARLEALAFSRKPEIKLLVEEKEYYADQDENVLGVITWDKPDRDWGYVVLGRDERSLFRAIEVEVSLEDIEMARSRLHQRISYYTVTGEKIFPQGDESRAKKFEIFKPLVPEDQLHPNFQVLLNMNGYSPAKEIIAEIAYSFKDPDGNYIQQFQTSAFDARLWELFLYAFLHENDFEIDRSYPAPDYLCAKYDEQIFVEAMTINPSQGKERTEASPETISDRDRLADYIAIKFGGPLTTKLNRKPPYWDMPHCKGKPLVFAIADFHQPGSMLWTHSYFADYLYGKRWRKVESGQGPQIVYEDIPGHVFGEKRIPSGFFSLPGAENVSAVIFSNCGTIAKFNRMGKLAGFGDGTLKMLRVGLQYNHERDSFEPLKFSKEIVEGICEETWSEGVSIFHNPNAKLPLDQRLFDTVGLAHHYFRDNRLVSLLPDFFPLSSVTHIVSAKKTESSSGSSAQAQES